jgi:DNA primase
MYGPVRLLELDSRDRGLIYSASRISLCQHPDGEPGREYLMGERGLTPGTIASFRLGFVPFSVKSALGRPLAGRIVMPIFDAYDDLVALSARPIWDRMCTKCQKPFRNSQTFMEGCCPACSQEGEKIEPKYWNEPFPKGEHLYGLSIAKYGIARRGFSICVEGQLDAASMHSCGFDNTVAVMGGALTHLHVLQMARWTKMTVLLFDGDEAGSKHLKRATDILAAYNLRWKQGPKPIFCGCAANLPKGSDPDKFVRKEGAGAMRQVIVSAMERAGFPVPEGYDK